MRPSKKHMKVDRYVDPAEFAQWKKVAEDMGFLYVASGPLVRSSYKAGEFFITNVLNKRREVRFLLFLSFVCCARTDSASSRGGFLALGRRRA